VEKLVAVVICHSRPQEIAKKWPEFSKINQQLLQHSNGVPQPNESLFMYIEGLEMRLGRLSMQLPILPRLCRMVGQRSNRGNDSVIPQLTPETTHDKIPMSKQ
jgi:hypothetical protein